VWRSERHRRASPPRLRRVYQLSKRISNGKQRRWRASGKIKTRFWDNRISPWLAAKQHRATGRQTEIKLSGTLSDINIIYRAAAENGRRENGALRMDGKRATLYNAAYQRYQARSNSRITGSNGEKAASPRFRRAGAQTLATGRVGVSGSGHKALTAMVASSRGRWLAVMVYSKSHLGGVLKFSVCCSFSYPCSNNRWWFRAIRAWRIA